MDYVPIIAQISTTVVIAAILAATHATEATRVAAVAVATLAPAILADATSAVVTLAVATRADVRERISDADGIAVQMRIARFFL